MRRSTEQECQEALDIVHSTREKIERLLRLGERVHIIWDFDGVLADSRSDDIFALSGYNLDAYFAHEERLLFQTPGQGEWLLPIALNQKFWKENFTQDIVTARSSSLAFRVQLFCLQWGLPVRWSLFLGHQPKHEAYRIILKSLKQDPNYHVFCIDDGAKHIEAFQKVCAEEGMENRATGVVSPVVRKYSEQELKDYYQRVMSATGNGPIRVRDVSDDTQGYLVLPGGKRQFKEQLNSFISARQSQSAGAELRKSFINNFGEVGKGYFKTEEQLQQAMRDFIVGLHC